jgi:hypothetical protein
MRYHGGGIAGLRPDEVPAILQRGEEVLTADDPRHRANGGVGGDVHLKNVIALDSADRRGERVFLTFLSDNAGGG